MALPTQKSKVYAFTLVEVTLALGIIVFAMIPMFALVPIGLSSFRNAIDATAAAHIIQSQVNEAQLTNFSILTSGTTKTAYYDEEGQSYDSSGAPIQPNTFLHKYTAMVTVSGTTTLPTASLNDAIALLKITISDVANPKESKTYTARIANLGI